MGASRCVPPLLFVPHEIGRLLDSECTVRFALNDESAGIRSTLSDYTPGRVILRCSPSVKGIGHLSHQRDMTEARFDRSWIILRKAGTRFNQAQVGA